MDVGATEVLSLSALQSFLSDRLFSDWTFFSPDAAKGQKLTGQHAVEEPSGWDLPSHITVLAEMEPRVRQDQSASPA